jgi:hypothetical protein
VRFTVTVAAHRVADRYDISATEKIIGGDTPQRARLTLLRWLHSDAGVPPWKPYLRESWPHTSAEDYVMTKEERMREKAKARAGGNSK